MAFFSTYELYKKGTQTIVNWLATTASRCGYESLEQKKKKKNKNKNSNRKLRAKGIEVGSESKAESLIPSVEPTSVPLRVGEPRTSVKPTKNDKISATRSAAPSSKYTVSTKELPMMATFISERFEQVSDFVGLPGILEVLQDVITKRKQWAKAFPQQDPSTSSSNERHKHFVMILEEVQQILGGVMKALNLHQAQPSVEQASEAASLRMDERALFNIFAVLKLEDPADVEQIIGEATEKSQPSTATTTIYELEEVDEEEIFFRILCFFNDFVDMRNHIRQSWGDYVSGILDLAAVAVTTNVALEMVQRAETELLEKMPKKLNLTTYKEIAGLLHIVIAETRGVNRDARQQPGDVINMELKDVADFTALPVYIILSSFLPVLEKQTLPVMKPGFFGEIDISGTPLSWRDQFTQHKIILLELLPEFCIVSSLDQLPPVVDELSRGLIAMMKTHRIPIWLVLGCQLYLDIHHAIILHPMGNMGIAHKELQKMGLYATQTLQSYVKFSEKMHIETWPKKNDEILQDIKTEAEEWINKDIYFPAQQQLLKQAKLPASIIRPYSLFSRHPLLCGLMLFRLNMRLQEAGVALVNAWGSLPSVLHLFNAVKHEDPNATFPPWEDLDAVINIHSKERIFVGDFPTNLEQYLKRFCLVMGWSASMFAPHRREGRNTIQMQTPASKRGPREMTTTSAVTDVFKPQYCGNEAGSDVTFHRIQGLLCAPSKKRPRASPFLPVPFISSLQAKIQADILALNIDYFALHMRCIDLLRNIRSTLHLDLVKLLQSPDYLEKESQLPFLVGYLFTIGCRSAMIAEDLNVSGRGVEVKSRTLLKSAEVIKKLVLNEGGIETKRVEEYCRGYDWLGTDGEVEVRSSSFIVSEN